MMQVPHNSQKKTAASYYKPAGSLKRDINLLPANENTQKAARIGTFALFICLGAALLALIVIIMPQMQLNSKANQANALSAQATSKARLSGKYDAALANKKQIQGILDSLSNSGKDQTIPADLMAQVSDACPDGILLTSVTFNAQGAQIEGLAPGDGAIAQFIVNLKTIPVYQYVGLNAVLDYKKSDAPAYKRSFKLEADYPPAPSPSPTPQPTPTATQEGGV
jgi:Tfp pilus assembly protein PilN